MKTDFIKLTNIYNEPYYASVSYIAEYKDHQICLKRGHYFQVDVKETADEITKLIESI